MKALTLVLAALLLAGCATPSFWTKSGATGPLLARDTEACYHASLATDYPAAMSRPTVPPAVATPKDAPPSVLWARAPQEVGFEHFEERLRYQKCMVDLGYRTTRPAPRP